MREFIKHAVYPAVVCTIVGYLLAGGMWFLIDRFGR